MRGAWSLAARPYFATFFARCAGHATPDTGAATVETTAITVAGIAHRRPDGVRWGIGRCAGRQCPMPAVWRWRPLRRRGADNQIVTKVDAVIARAVLAPESPGVIRDDLGCWPGAKRRQESPDFSRIRVALTADEFGDGHPGGGPPDERVEGAWTECSTSSWRVRPRCRVWPSGAASSTEAR